MADPLAALSLAELRRHVEIAREDLVEAQSYNPHSGDCVRRYRVLRTLRAEVERRERDVDEAVSLFAAELDGVL
jgi:hypothetical protein